MSAGKASDKHTPADNEEDADFNSDDLFKSFMDIANDLESQIASSSDSIVTLTDESTGADEDRDSIQGNEQNENYIVSDISEGFDKLASLLSSIQDVIDEKRSSFSSSIDSSEKRCSSGSLLDELQETGEATSCEQNSEGITAAESGAEGITKSNGSECKENGNHSDNEHQMDDKSTDTDLPKAEKPKPSALEILEFLSNANIPYFGDENDSGSNDDENDDKFRMNSSICKQLGPMLRFMGSSDNSDIGSCSARPPSGSDLPSNMSTGSSDDYLNTDSEKDIEDSEDQEELKFEEIRQRLQSDSSTCSENDFRSSYLQSGHSGETLPRSEDYCSGYLLKLGGTGIKPKNWKKRWFVLRKDNCFYYYKSSKDKVPLGIIVLSNYIVSKALDANKKFAFKLVKGGGRSYVFCTDSEKSMMKWMQSLNVAAASSVDEANFSIDESSVHNVSIPALSIKEPDCHGYLQKQGQGIKSWRRRYCVLKNGYLYYYNEMADTTALGVAKLHGCTIQEYEGGGKKNGFIAKPPKKEMRTFCFVADSETDKKRWMARIEKSIKDAESL